jgi:regulator of protease activity HflC (stomatin/prohibitin superfamily)
VDPRLIPYVAYAAIPVIILLFGSVSVIKQGHVGVTVLFGKFNRLLQPGLSFRVPFVEKVFRSISLQLHSAELEFQAITGDQANVNFKALIIYTVADSREETIIKAAFKFNEHQSFMQ